MMNFAAKGALLFAAASFSAPAAAATVQFADGDFDLSSYTFAEYALAGYNTAFNQNGEIVGSDFNLFFSYSYSRNGANSAGNRLQAFNTSFVYDPTTQGAITSIDASLAQRAFLTHNNVPVSLANANSVLRVLALQGGVVYEAAAATGPIGAQNVWYGTSLTGLVASDFLRFDPANPNGTRTETGLDFGGGAITFGFELTPFGIVQGNGQPVTGNSVASWQADDFRLTVNAADLVAGVPEPSSWALLILGFGAVGAGMRARKGSGGLPAPRAPVGA